MKKYLVTSLMLFSTFSNFSYADHHNMYVTFDSKNEKLSVVKNNGEDPEKFSKEYQAWQKYVRSSVAFACGSNCNSWEEVSVDGTLNSHAITLHTRVKKLTAPKHNALASAFFGRFKNGGYGIVYKTIPVRQGHHPLTPKPDQTNSAYYYNTPLYINSSKVKGGISILIDETPDAGAFDKSKSRFSAVMNNNPYGDYLVTEDGHCYQWEAPAASFTRTNEKVTIHIEEYPDCHI